MSNEANIQYKAPHRHADGLGFEDDAIVPTTSVQIDQDEAQTREDGLDVEQLLDLLMLANAKPEAVGQRVILLSFLMPRCSRRPQTIRELGDRLGCSHTEARRKCSKLRAEFAREMTDSRPADVPNGTFVETD